MQDHLSWLQPWGQRVRFIQESSKRNRGAEPSRTAAVPNLAGTRDLGRSASPKSVGAAPFTGDVGGLAGEAACGPADRVVWVAIAIVDLSGNGP